MPDREKLIELLNDALLSVDWDSHDYPDTEKATDILIANGVTIADERPILLAKSDTISEEKMRELMNGPAIFHTGKESIVPIYPYQWISVKDRLPEEYENVLVYDAYEVLPGVYYGERGFWTYDSYEAESIYCVTHWMPMPDPPNMEVNKNDR